MPRSELICYKKSFSRLYTGGNFNPFGAPPFIAQKVLDILEPAPPLFALDEDVSTSAVIWFDPLASFDYGIAKDSEAEDYISSDESITTAD